ncbi:inositol monophosphatase [Mycolicibacterium smegmatis]|uniref:inositol monophosphatase family protein n=1 Tax=Mycolicibacterium smegmatis TaxID=1772 RepID=UPI0005D8C134|nr:inositol monophosphatase family protein [Mycolicibacterium smegmatis]MDF1900860.1 inositol monophosphatase family protein [Mycolicibacterium smegmatis]MDF1905367.1 inositol monophosphatase family protein [Mycolicibacterium smegmatis]MDF1915937.1 inositol monophosphatase family protein [Mycolicibacterium smegmatis]MDF1923579.1 inositol monophosphatase family protein [Mycolicibacterium smegmatis]UAK55073.1 inositol monophosphatase [Mycolicibacterium smegmatis]
MTHPADTELRRLAVKAAERGADVCLRHLGELVSVATKSAAGDVVTAVDRAAEEAVRAVLREARPDDSMLGEEIAEHTGSGPLQWVIDPLDGTTNYTRRIPYFATSVAVRRVSDGTWLAGAVCAPALGSTWSAARGEGAQLDSITQSAQLPLQLIDSTARLVGTGLSYDPGLRRRQLRDLGALVCEYTDMRRFGAAAVDLCLVAQGSLDAFVEADLAVHDWAAGALIAEEAGAEVTRPCAEGDPLSARWR